MEFSLIAPLALHPTVEDILMRLGATVLAGGLIGYNRERGGHAAGFRTTILVGLAACLSMIEGNILLTTPIGEEHTAVRLDVLRFALGTLTGVGFIGAGCIMHKGDLVTGVTTAATLWVITAIGICFGGGQLLLGGLATIAAFIVLSPMQVLSSAVRRREKAIAVLRQPVEAPLPDLGPPMKEIKASTRFLSRKRAGGEPGVVLLTYEITWRERPGSRMPGELVTRLEQDFDLVSVDIANAEL